MKYCESVTSCSAAVNRNKNTREEAAGVRLCTVHINYLNYTKMHVVHTCLSIYDVWICLLFIEKIHLFSKPRNETSYELVLGERRAAKGASQ